MKINPNKIIKTEPKMIKEGIGLSPIIIVVIITLLFGLIFNYQVINKTF